MNFLLADAALPLIYFTLPSVILMLIPVILVEGILLRIWLPTSAWKAMKASAVSNTISTLAGVLLASLLAFLSLWAVSPWTEHLFDRDHWQSPLGDVLMAMLNSVYISAYVVEARWLLPAALLTILLPAYLISWQIEYGIVKRMNITDLRNWPDGPTPRAISRAVRRANFVSYVLLYAFIAIRLVRSQL